MKLVIDNIILSPDCNDDAIVDVIKKTYGISDFSEYQILRKSLDSRNKYDIKYKYRICIEVSSNKAKELLKQNNISIFKSRPSVSAVNILKGKSVIIVGAGPAGLFSALRLIESGAVVNVIERGKQINERLRDIQKLENSGILNEESNVLFGEGGAGAYSDGKLTTRTHKPEIDWVFKKLIQFGAHESIIYDSRPHLGSDKIRTIIKNIRNYINSNGSTIHFNEKILDLVVINNSVAGVVSESGNEYLCDTVILAPGHSARDIYSMLDRKGVALGKKGFSAGLRIEHPSRLIDDIQYGDSKYKQHISPAYYSMVYNNNATGRGIYTFCMCPGGYTINSSSENGGICVNGMSYSARSSGFSNSAIVVTVHPEDLDVSALSGINFQRNIERKAYDIGGDYRAPVQRITDFIKGTCSKTVPYATYRPGVIAADLNSVLPIWITDEIKNALIQFEKKMRGYITESGIFIGVETRTSSPVRILRNDRFESVNLKGLYPAGEGAGYAGGIISSAVDGVRTADSISSAVVKST